MSAITRCRRIEMKAEKNRLNHGSRSARRMRTDIIHGRDSASTLRSSATEDGPRCPRPKRAQHSVVVRFATFGGASCQSRLAVILASRNCGRDGALRVSRFIGTARCPYPRLVSSLPPSVAQPLRRTGAPPSTSTRDSGGFTAGDAAARRPYLAMGCHFRSPMALWQTVWNTN